jgi:hypothetical protein
MLKLTTWDNNTFTVVGFETLLKTLEYMPKLTLLDMQLPHVKRFEIIGMMSIHLLFDLGVGNRGAQFITQNLKNLTILSVGKHWSDSD